MAPQLGWIGLGNMGKCMTKNLVEKGNLESPLILYNRTTSVAEELSQKIGFSTVSKTVEDLVAKCDIIFMCLGSDTAVLSVVEQIVKNCDINGKLIVDCSTVHPDLTTKENDLIIGAGGEFVSFPVFGPPAVAEKGQLVCVFAGEANSVAKVIQYGQGVIGRANIDFSGQPPRKATLLKIIGNTFTLAMVETLSEGHVLAEKTGLGAKELHQFIDFQFAGHYTAYSNRLMTGDYYKRDDPLVSVDLGRKDAGHARKLAEQYGFRMRNVELADHYLEGVQKHMGAKGDIAGMFGSKREEAGLRYENDEKSECHHLEH